MDNKFIEQMRAELYDTRLCRSDFEKYDVEELKENTEPFFWMVREHGTTLLKIGASEIARWFSNECCRFDMFRNPDAPFGYISYYSNYEHLKIFYWDGLDLRRITMQDAANIYDNLVTPMWEQKIQQYPKEYEMRSKPLEIQKEIPTEFGETLSWEYLCYARKHPIKWSVPTCILYGGKDHLTSRQTVSGFADQIGAKLTVMKDGEHWFHTEEQMKVLDQWISSSIR